MMILAIDIGNTTTNFGVFRGGRLAQTFSVPTRECRTAAGVARRLRKHRAAIAGAEQAILCSVVPWATPKVIAGIRSVSDQVLGIRVVGRGLRVPLRNRYRYPEQVGQDRLVGAYAAWRAYGAPRERPAPRRVQRTRQRKSSDIGRDVIVCDFGTAMTIDVVTKAGEYLGGVIAPGLDISLEALASRTALLPKVDLREPPELLGRDTANSIRSGLLYGCVALCDGLVARLKRQYAPSALVIGTGGSSSLIAKHARSIDHLRPNLVLEGLYQLSLPSTKQPR